MTYALFIWERDECRIVAVYQDNAQAVSDGRALFEANRCQRFNVVEVPYYANSTPAPDEKE